MKHLPPESHGFHVKRARDESGAVRPGAVAEALRALGIDVCSEYANALATHASAVLEATTRFNLTAIRDPERFVLLHIVDSLAPIGTIMEAPEGPGIDIGTGAGYPGLPVALIMERGFTLVEATRKKADFVRGVCEDLGLGHVEVVCERAEQFATRRPGAYSLALARAVGPLPTIVELAAPLLSRGGLLVAYKGVPEQEEIERGDRAAVLCGLEKRELVRYELPGPHARSVIVYTKVADPQVRHPRRPGMAARKPLA